MAKKTIPFFNLWKETLEMMGSEGLLLCTVGRNGRPNVMTIGWMTGGYIWSKPILTVLVRHSRFTFSRLEEVGEFTVNVLPPPCAAAVQVCGAASGREGDKFAQTGLTPAPSQKVRPPIVAEGRIHYECRVVFANEITPETLAPEIKAASYRAGDFHRVYYGEILAAYAADV